ncbi:hypothetical protein SH528x_007265 [Novipirellula sp. SH528]|uniref:hypothetical protein n=1 Tax=Novipirellula sp. SH528 TaxID=3454466 RepID=UPI003FA069AF
MRHNQALFDLADRLTEPPNGGPIQMWSVGAFLSAVVTFFGVSCCITQRATTLNITTRGFRPLGRGLWVDIAGTHAVTFGLLLIGIGLFMHFHWFWGNHKRLFLYHEIPKYAAAVGVIAAMIAHVFTMITRT